MLMESGKIYQRKYFKDSLLCPTLEIKGTATVYVSNATKKPADVSEMSELKNIEPNSLLVLTGMTKWIAVSYEDSDESTEVYEMGLIKSPYVG